ncbi:MAG: FAD:protein FMN transferase [Alphaproteobacteria bacterium]|nr:FAD:protein FMN transferase [Alphaproteobacteria bacterium]
MKITRRRFLAVSAAAGLAWRAPARAGTFRWRGVALGAPASIALAGLDRAAAAGLAERVEAEISRLERIFSLYRADSELSRLNRAGRLEHPSHEMLELLDLARLANETTGGAFDPTVQPFWRLHAQAAARNRAATPAEKRAALLASGWRHVRAGAGFIRFRRPGMALTLNGIAQGYIADRVAGLLRARGLVDVLVDTGETKALGRRADGKPWRAGIVLPDGTPVARRTLSGRALATSAPLATLLDAARGAGHILDPRTGEPTARWRLASVSAPRAALADALSTAFCLMERRAIDAALARHPDAALEALVS